MSGCTDQRVVTWCADSSGISKEMRRRLGRHELIPSGGPHLGNNRETETLLHGMMASPESVFQGADLTQEAARRVNL
jgi:hypothetical protein